MFLQVLLLFSAAAFVVVVVIFALFVGVVLSEVNSLQVSFLVVVFFFTGAGAGAGRGGGGVSSLLRLLPVSISLCETFVEMRLEGEEMDLVLFCASEGGVDEDGASTSVGRFWLL